MSAIVKVVPKKDWEIVKKYINSGEFNSGIVLIPEDVFNELSLKEQRSIECMDEYLYDYDFGGECDVSLDVVLSSKHHFIGNYCLPEEKIRL